MSGGSVLSLDLAPGGRRVPLPEPWRVGVAAALVAVTGAGLYRLRSRRVETRSGAVLEERSRIARELHDTVAQDLAGLSLQLESAVETLFTSPEVAGDHLDRARALVRASLDDSRRAVCDLRSRDLEEGDLAAALEIAARRATEGAAVAVEVRVEGARRRLARGVEEDLLRIGQEALANALRHAAPSAVRVDLRLAAKRATLVVADDGRGFEPAAASLGRLDRFGLVGMRERAERLGGRLEVRSRPGAGTQIEATVPLGRMAALAAAVRRLPEWRWKRARRSES
jgi:signal transduction histidine kinase